MILFNFGCLQNNAFGTNLSLASYGTVRLDSTPAEGLQYVKQQHLEMEKQTLSRGKAAYGEEKDSKGLLGTQAHTTPESFFLNTVIHLSI